MDAIKTISLTKYYGRSRGIIDMNLTVADGDFFGFIGPNGAGKSTTIRTLLGLIAPSEGSAQILGMDIIEKEAILSRVGYMPSEASFYRNARVADMIRFSASLRHRDCRAEAEVLCERLELDTSKKIRELSLGNRKKVSIICALQHMPDLCILDEPTSGLDPLMQREFYALLEERNKNGTSGAHGCQKSPDKGHRISTHSARHQGCTDRCRHCQLLIWRKSPGAASGFVCTSTDGCLHYRTGS